ncbi:MAG TPA: hypothetical protein VND45_03455 [Thermoanaerobaculia bacterium]|jgi:hypothetical protein|nr:hypothetical protein [Thermoanaerobaculia bacterium]
MIIVAFLLWLTTVAPAAEKHTPAAIVGVWQMCYEPGLPGVSEIDHAYLVLQPDGRYVRVQSGIGEPATTETGTYKITRDGVTLHPLKRLHPSGKRGGGHVYSDSTARLRGVRRVVLSSEKDRVRQLPVLSSHTSLNYAWAKVL